MKIKKQYFSFVIIIMITILLFAGCAEKKSDSDDSNDGENSGTSISKGISAKEAWEKLESIVKSWNPDFKIARVYHFGTGLWTSDANENSWEFYVESGDGDKSTDFTYSIEDGISKRADTNFDTGRYTFSVSNWSIDSDQATEIALTAIKENEFPNFDGGLEAELEANEDGDPYWTIDYSSRKKDGKYDLSIPLDYGAVQINAKTGEIISITGKTG